MTDADLPPRPVSPEQKYFAAIWGLLGQQNELLAQIRDRLPAPAAMRDGAVELREPHAPQGPAGGEEVPDVSDGRPAPPARRTRKPKPVKETG